MANSHMFKPDLQVCSKIFKLWTAIFPHKSLGWVVCRCELQITK